MSATNPKSLRILLVDDFEIVRLMLRNALNDLGYNEVEEAEDGKQAMIKLVLAHVGISCQKEMRLSGRVDSGKLTFTRFETSCAKGARLYGKLWIDEKRVVSLLVREEAKAENREAFLDSIK